MSTRIVQVDAFTAQPFAGNPAAVCVLPAPRDEEWMRNVAREMNLSETAFLHPVTRWRLQSALADAGRRGGSLRPRHAGQRARSLGRRPPRAGCGRALSHAQRPADLQTQRRLDRDGLSGQDSPNPPKPRRNSPRRSGAELKYMGKNQFDYLVEVADETTLRALNPNHHLLRQLPVRGVIVTARAAPITISCRAFSRPARASTKIR